MEEVGLAIHNKRVAHEEQKCKEELEKDELDMRKKHKREALLYWLVDQKKYNFELLISSDYWKRHTFCDLYEALKTTSQLKNLGKECCGAAFFFTQKSCNNKNYMIIYPHAAIIRKAVNVSINISAINLTGSDDRADNPMTQPKDEYCLRK